MRTEVPFRCGRSLFASLVVISALLLAIADRPSLAADEQDSSTTISGLVVAESGKPLKGIIIRCADFADEKMILGETDSKEKGKFTLTIPANAAQKIQCSIVRSDLNETDARIIPGGRNSQVVFTMKYPTIDKVSGWIQIPGGWDPPNILVRVTQSNGVTKSQRPDKEESAVTFTDVKAGPAMVEYIAPGLEKKTKEDFILAQGSDISETLGFDWFPSGLILLIPGVSVVFWWAWMNMKWAGDPDKQRRTGEFWLISISLGAWVFTFFLLWLLLKFRGGGSLHFLHPQLAFPLFVPIFGFVGALIFALDLLRTDSRDRTTSKASESAPTEVSGFREFALRLVLGPYVAIVMALLFSGTFEFVNVSDKFGSQATVAFFSGFLVVFVLQNLTEKGNELLGQWRASSRYEPSEIARKFKLRMDDDVKLQKVNLKYLAQLRALSEDPNDLSALAKHTELGAGFLLGLVKDLNRDPVDDDLHARLGEDIWNKLGAEGVKTVGDVALLSPERIKEIATNQKIDENVLTTFANTCKKTFAQVLSS